jgi:hypothetical protein
MSEIHDAWKVHWPNLAKEILKNDGTAILRIPLQITGTILADIATRAAELKDPELLFLIANLTLYAGVDPDDADYNPAMHDQLRRDAEAAREARRTAAAAS